MPPRLLRRRYYFRRAITLSPLLMLSWPAAADAAIRHYAAAIDYAADTMPLFLLAAFPPAAITPLMPLRRHAAMSVIADATTPLAAAVFAIAAALPPLLSSCAASFAVFSFFDAPLTPCR
jgi:hypothetical protein